MTGPSGMRRWAGGATGIIVVTALMSAYLVGAMSSAAATNRALVPHVSHGTAAVACAGSLDKLYYDTLGPDFKKASGDSFGGPPCAGSLALAQEINSGAINPGVFLSIGAAAIKELFPTKRAKFAMAMASDRLVIGYSKNSRYFSQLNKIKTGKKPLSHLFKLLTTPGFRLGRTDPTQDPQGIFFILMAKLAQKDLHLAAGEADRALGITKSNPYGSSSQMYDEDALPTDIKQGVVDAGSEYLPEAKQYGLDYITLPSRLNFGDPADSSYYSTASLKVNGVVQKGEVIYLDTTLVLPKSGTKVSARDAAADRAFVAFLLKGTARKELTRVGYLLPRPVLQLAPGVTLTQALPRPILALFKKLRGRTGS